MPVTQRNQETEQYSLQDTYTHTHAHAHAHTHTHTHTRTHARTHMSVLKVKRYMTGLTQEYNWYGGSG